MKKAAYVILFLLSGFLIWAKPAGKQKEFVSAPVYCDWSTNHFSVSNEEFKNVKAGDEISIQFQPAEDYSRLFILYNDHKDWQNYLFSNVVCTPQVRYVSQEQTDEKTQQKRMVTKIAPNDGSKDIVTAKITLTASEAKILNQWGLIICGSNFHLVSCKLNTTGAATKEKVPKKNKLLQYYGTTAATRESLLKQKSDEYVTPIIYVTTESGKAAKKEYSKAMIDVVNCDAEFVLSAEGQFKIRGNSTADDRWSPKVKPYKIKFNEKQGMLGLHKGKQYKSWVLLKAEGFNAQDYLGFKLAHEIYKTSKFNYYASDCAFVHVFVNGQDAGIHLLCEQNEVAKGRVNVNDSKPKDGKSKIGYMIELDNYSWEDVKDGGRYFGTNCSKGKEDYHFSVHYLSPDEKDNTTFMVWGYSQEGVKLKDINGEERGCPVDDFTIKSKIYSDSQVELIQRYMTNLWNICYQAIEKNAFYKFDSEFNMVPAPEYKSAKETCAAVIDLESLCNEMILEELVRDNDVGAGSLYMAIDFTRAPGEKYSKFTFECPWDFNWGYFPIENDSDKGEYWNGKTQYFACGWQTVYLLEDKSDRSHPWYILFNNAPWFRKMLREKWNQIGPENLRKVTYKTDKVVGECGKDIGGADAAWVTGFVRNRIDYIDKNCWKY